MAKTGIQVAFGQAIRKIRLKKGMTQEHLAEKTDLHPTYISDIERGERNVSLENIVAIAHALKLRTFELFKEVSKEF